MEGPTCFIKTDRTPDKFSSNLATFLEDHPEIRSSVVGGSPLSKEVSVHRGKPAQPASHQQQGPFAASAGSILHPPSRSVDGLSFASYHHPSPGESPFVSTSIGEEQTATKGHFIESILGRKARERMNRGGNLAQFAIFFCLCFNFNWIGTVSDWLYNLKLLKVFGSQLFLICFRHKHNSIEVLKINLVIYLCNITALTCMSTFHILFRNIKCAT